MMEQNGTTSQRAIGSEAGQDRIGARLAGDGILSIPSAGGQDSVRAFGYLTAVTRSSGI